MLEPFGTAPDASEVYRVTLRNGGAMARLLTWGARLQDYRIAGVAHPLVLGAPNLQPYFDEMNYFGCIVGRVANRVAKGRAMLGGQMLDLDRNEAGRTTLHGGATGSSAQNWEMAEIAETRCTFALRLPDGQGGFPGNLDIRAIYSLDDEGALHLEMSATTDAPTFCNLAHHSYWNLDGSGDASDHTLCVNASRYLPVDKQQYPLGAPSPVEGTGFDYREARSLRGRDELLDHNYCLEGEGLRRACILSSAVVRLEVLTDAPGLQVYDGSGLSIPEGEGLDGRGYGPGAGIAIEPQHWPDAPNHPSYPSIRLNPGETYRQVSIFKPNIA